MVRVLLRALNRTLQNPGLGRTMLGVIAWPGVSLLGSPPTVAEINPSSQPWTKQRTLVMTCTGRFEANNIDFTVTYSSEGGFSEVILSRDGAAIASADLGFNGINDNDQKVWRGTTTGKAEIVLIHLSDGAVQPGDDISIGHNGRWGRGQCAGSYWYSNGA